MPRRLLLLALLPLGLSLSALAEPAPAERDAGRTVLHLSETADKPVRPKPNACLGGR